jgi:hypothetical protein
MQLMISMARKHTNHRLFTHDRDLAHYGRPI